MSAGVEIPRLSRGEIAAAVVGDCEALLPMCALSAAVHGEPAWAETICVRLSSHRNPAVRRGARAGLDYLKRRLVPLAPRARAAIERAADGFYEAFALVR